MILALLQNDCTEITEETNLTENIIGEIKKEWVRKIKLTTFITVVQQYPIGVLTSTIKKGLQGVNGWIAPKFTSREHVKRVGFLSGVNVKHGNIKWYTNTLNSFT